MQTIQNASPSLFELASLLDERSAGIDPDFDAVYDDLDREFAEARLQFSNE